MLSDRAYDAVHALGVATAARVRIPGYRMGHRGSVSFGGTSRSAAMTTDETQRTMTFVQWHNALCAEARRDQASASMVAPWMHDAYEYGYTPAEAWEAFTNNERI